MNRLPTTNPIEVTPSWIPYSNSVAPSTLIAIGSSSTFHRPNEKNTGAPSRNSERSMGVPRMVRIPSRRLSTTAPTDVISSSDVSTTDRVRIRKMQPAEKTNVSASIQNAQRTSIADSRPAAANPIAVDPNDAIDRNAFAALSSSSLAISGISASYAGSKNILTPAFTRIATNSRLMLTPSRNGISATMTA